MAENGLTGRRRRAAFTLVELLVVIGIITVLVGILLPTLGRARAQAETVACQSNMRQVVMGFLQYSLNNRYIPSEASDGWSNNLDWAGKGTQLYFYRVRDGMTYDPPLKASVMWKYLSPNILTCPTQHRNANNLYDYTFEIAMAGAKTNLTWKVSYPLKPADPNSPRAYFDGMPLMIEENSVFTNTTIDDGSWSWGDQFSTIHKGRCSIGFLDGSVGLFTPPMGKNPNKIEPEDLDSTKLLLHVGSSSWPIWKGYGYGWVNHPK